MIPSHITSLLKKNLDFQQIALFLDIDGTLVGFEENPEQVFLSSEMKRILQHLYDALQGSIALVTGRSICSAEQVVGLSPIEIVGLHGAEVRHEDGSLRCSDYPHQQLELAKVKLHHYVNEHAGLLLEDKGAGIALHYNQRSEMQDTCYHLVKSLVSNLGESFSLLEGRYVYEIKLAEANKGHAIETLLKKSMFKDKMPWFIGDDVTDEAGFEAVNKLEGISICVGIKNESKANYYCPDINAVQNLLGNILENILTPLNT